MKKRKNLLMRQGIVQSITVPAWKSYDWLRHGFSTRAGGVSTVYRNNLDASLNLGWTREDDPLHVSENRRLLVDSIAFGAEFEPLVTLKQVHTSAIHVVRWTDESFVSEDGRALREGDGLMTNLASVLLGIQTADCVPVMLVDPVKRAVGVFHAGWRGTAAGIVEQGVGKMVSQFRSQVEDLTAAIGPSIGPCCYKVGGEVETAFRQQFPYADRLLHSRDEELALDLWEANRQQLISAGMADERITVVGECTGCAVLDGARRYFSHRMEHGVTGRMMSVIGIANSI
jgi:YfiH family protein